MNARSSRARAALARGYTIVELLMSLTVLAIGTSGVIAMQKVTLSANRYAKNLSVATRIGEAWADELSADAMLWTFGPTGSTFSNTDWLKNLGTVSWIRPTYSTSRRFGPAFDALGQPVDPSTSAALAAYCVDIRLAWVRNEVLSATNTTEGNGVVRAQIRVFWRREDAQVAPVAGNLCTAANSPVQVDATLGAYHVIYLTTAVRETPRWRQ